MDFAGLKKLGVVLKRAQYFINCQNKGLEGLRVNQDSLLRALVSDNGVHKLSLQNSVEQLSFFDDSTVSREDVAQCLTGQI